MSGSGLAVLRGRYLVCCPLGDLAIQPGDARIPQHPVHLFLMLRGGERLSRRLHERQWLFYSGR